MGILWTIIIGFIVGIIARLLMPGRDPAGFIMTTLLGIAGAFFGTLVGRTIGWYGPNDAAGFVASVIGAMLLLFIYHIFFTSRDTAVRT